MYKTYYVYMMTSARNTALYTGITNDINRRVAEHKSGAVPGFTQKYCCHKLVYYEEYSDVLQAIIREKVIKKYSRAKKDALINKFNPEWEDLAVAASYSK